MALHGFTRILGITLLLLVICIVTTAFNPVFVDTYNLSNLLRWTALFGILGLGVAFVIITGGIDLSIGSVVALTGIVMMHLLQPYYVDTGQRLSIIEVDPVEQRIKLAEPISGIRDQDQIWVVNPAFNKDVTEQVSEYLAKVTYDGKATEKLDSPEWVVMRDGVSSSMVGTKGRLYKRTFMNQWVALALTLAVGVAIGLFHGVLIGYCKLQPFIVTLCGLMGYRGIARLVSGDQTLSLDVEFSPLRELATGQAFEIPVPFIEMVSKPAGSSEPAGLFGWVPLPIPMLILLVFAILGAVFLHKSVAGRYLLAMGRSEEAARFSGINTRRMTLLAYVLCSTLAALGGILFALDVNTVQPSGHGNFYELYAIAAAVLGGCSLRGGVGSIAGVIIGTAVMRSLYNAINLLEYPTYWEYIIIGGVLLIGVMIDELGRLVINHVKTRRRREKLAARGPDG